MPPSRLPDTIQPAPYYRRSRPDRGIATARHTFSIGDRTMTDPIPERALVVVADGGKALLFRRLVPATQ